MRGTPRRLIWGALAALLPLGLTQCAREPRALELIRARGELRVVTLNEPTAWYSGAHGPQGLEYELARAFAERLGVRLTIYPVGTQANLRAELRDRRADLVAAHQAYGALWLPDALPTRPYEQVRQVVVFRRSRERPRDLESLIGHSVVVAAAGPQVAVLSSLKARGNPRLAWVEVAGGADPLAEVDAGRAEFAVVDASEFGFARNLYPSLAIGFDLESARPAQWIVHRGALDLRAAVDDFFAELARSGQLPAILARAGADSQRFRFEAARELLAHIENRLPGLQPLFETAAARTGVDWRLLAAIGYQESQWNPAASSDNGAGGVMMLMPDTADALGVEDRHDPLQNILAGARYFVQVREMIPARIAEPDRTWFALAAYNVGFGHLEDARILAQIRGRNPDRWSDVRTQLPLLADEQWYPQAKRGYARGWEPVRFVERVQGFLNVLEWRSARPPSEAPVDVAEAPERTAARS